MTASPLLRVRELVTTFRTEQGMLRAVDDVSFDLGEGSTLCIVGESGCGKSVTALSILRLIPYPQGFVERGKIELRGKDILALSEREMQDIRGNEISMIFQEPMTSLNPVYAVGTQIVEAIRLHQKKSRREARERAIEMLRLVGIPSPETNVDAYPHQLSGGMRQRVMIAMALACEPRVLIADEPTTALDVTIQAQILDLLGKLQKQLGMSVVLITHDLGVVAEVATDVVVMYAGRVVEQAPVGKLFAHPRHPYTKGLLQSLPSFDKTPLAHAASPEAPVDEEAPESTLAIQNPPSIPLQAAPVVAHVAPVVGETPRVSGVPASHRKRARLPTIEGLVPDLFHLPSGCRFADRCPMVIDACREKEPELTTIEAEGDDPTHLARCIRANEV